MDRRSEERWRGLREEWREYTKLSGLYCNNAKTIIDLDDSEFTRLVVGPYINTLYAQWSERSTGNWKLPDTDSAPHFLRIVCIIALQYIYTMMPEYANAYSKSMRK